MSEETKHTQPRRIPWLTIGLVAVIVLAIAFDRKYDLFIVTLPKVQQGNFWNRAAALAGEHLV